MTTQTCHQWINLPTIIRGYYARDGSYCLPHLANDQNYLRYQAFLHTRQGPLQADQQSNNITLLEVLVAVSNYLTSHFDEFDIPENFVKHELKNLLERLSARFDRYIQLNNKQTLRGRRGFEF